MDLVLGALLTVVGAGLLVGNRALAEATTRSNIAATGGRFAGAGWMRWNRFVYLLVGACLAVAGLGVAFDLVQVKGG